MQYLGGEWVGAGARVVRACVVRARARPAPPCGRCGVGCVLRGRSRERPGARRHGFAAAAGLLRVVCACLFEIKCVCTVYAPLAAAVWEVVVVVVVCAGAGEECWCCWPTSTGAPRPRPARRADRPANEVLKLDIEIVCFLPKNMSGLYIFYLSLGQREDISHTQNTARTIFVMRFSIWTPFHF